MSDSELTVANHGIWIPNTVWESKELSIQEKALLARINGFTECFASNQYLADFLGLSVTRVKVIIKSLTDKGFITRTEERQGQLTVKRTLSVVKAKYYGVEGHEPENGPTPARKQAHPQPENGHHNNTELVIQNNNTDMSPTGSACSFCDGKAFVSQMNLSTQRREIHHCVHCQGTGKEPTCNAGSPVPTVKESLTVEQPPKADKPLNVPFDDFWNLYNKKTGRKKSEAKWKRLTNKDRAAIMEHLPNYIRNTPDVQYRKNPETYLNNESWNDELPNMGKPKRPDYPENQGVDKSIHTKQMTGLASELTSEQRRAAQNRIKAMLGDDK